jgi:fused signal recognition particle receptor
MFGFFKQVKNVFLKTRSLLGQKIRALFGKPWSDNTFAEFEQTLYEADLGSQIATDLTDYLKASLRKKSDTTLDDILTLLRTRALEILATPPRILPASGHPLVFLIVGINGSGKTTSIAKLANLFTHQGKKVLLAAGDTFRAAAIDQLSLWAERLKLDIVKSKPGSDPSAVAFDALTAAKARGSDVVFIDTAGRLQNKTDLMHELSKMKRTCDKVIPGAPHEVILVLDATIGQNALDQALVFHQFTPLTGILLAKLDGSAKGGIVLAIYKQCGIPIRWIGVGESAGDLLPFDPHAYVHDLFES